MRERHWPPPRAVPQKREYLKWGMPEGGLGGKSGGGGPSPHIFYERKKPGLTSLSPTGNLCLIAGLSPPNIGLRSRRGFLNKKLQFYFPNFFTNSSNQIGRFEPLYNILLFLI